MKSININFQKRNKSKIPYIHLYTFFVSIGFFVLIIRLFQLTIVKGNYYRYLSEKNRIKEQIIEAPRGKITDRKGFILAKNQGVKISQSGQRIKSRRIYYSPRPFAHLIGYEQIASKEKIENNRCLNKLRLGDKVGASGIEKIFDCQLRGKNGKKLVEINSKGKLSNTLAVINPIPGKDVQLSVDAELQQKAFELIKKKRGAVVAIKPDSGEIIILTSSPSFNPQNFADGRSEISQYFKDKDRPLFNRATEGTYPPGSVFKIVMAVGALEEKKIDEKTLFEDKGTIKAGPISFGNWYFLQYGKTEGMVDIVKAIQRSNDIFFYQTGALLGSEKIHFWAEKFGFGETTKSGLHENKGSVPSSFWKEEKLHERWFLGDTYNFSIGQGYLLATPIQVAIATAAIANNGFLCQPQLLKIGGINSQAKSNCKNLHLSQKTISLVKEGMTKACAPGGTGWPFFHFSIKSIDKNKKMTEIPVKVGCKTGTAESQKKDSLPHAWFTIFAPAKNPEIILTVLIENSGEGSNVSAPIAKEILKTYFERRE